MLRIMQVGYGYWGHNVAKKLKQSNKFDFAYIAETDPIKREQAAEEYNDVSVLADYHDGLDNVDVIAICTQTEYSYSVIMDAVDAGVCIFTEKPLAKNEELARKIVNAVESKGLILHCDHLMIYHPIIQYMKMLIDNGDIGDIIYMDVARVNLGPIRKDINAMLDLAVHDIAVADYFVDGLTPQSVHAIGTGFDGGQETITYLTMKNKNLLININSSWISPVKVRRITVGGTKKMMIFDDLNMNHKLSVYDSGVDVVQGNTYGKYEFLTRVGDVYKPFIKWEDALQNSLEHFAECVKLGKKSLSGPDQCLRIMHILDEAQVQLN